MSVGLWSSLSNRDIFFQFAVIAAPHGEIMMVSKAYGGRATDSEIMNGTELLPNLEEGDRVLGTIQILYI